MVYSIWLWGQSQINFQTSGYSTAQRPSAVGAGSATVSAGSTKETLSFVEIASSGDGVESPLAGVCELHISDATIRFGEDVCVERIVDLIRAVRRA